MMRTSSRSAINEEKRPMDKEAQFESLKQEIVRLFDYVQRIKLEIASVKHPLSSVDHFDSVADQLEAIVISTEAATNTIMEAAESIQDTSNELNQTFEYAGAKRYFDDIGYGVNSIFEACSFQDITGQRISKIIKTMTLIEGTLNSLVSIIGEQGLAELPIAEDAGLPEGEAPLDGPALEGEGVSQADIDKLFD